MNDTNSSPRSILHLAKHPARTSDRGRSSSCSSAAEPDCFAYDDKICIHGSRVDETTLAEGADSPLLPGQSRAILRLAAPYADGSRLQADVETATFWREPLQPSLSDNAIAATTQEVSLVSDSKQLRYRIVAEGSHQRVVRSLIGLAHSGQPATRTIGESQRIGRGDQMVSEAEVRQLWKVLNRAESLDALDANRSNL